MEFSFSQNQTVEDINAVPESFRGAYAQGQDGKYTVAPEFMGFATAIDGLNTALRRERDAHGNLKKQPTAAAVLEALGFDSVDAAKGKYDELNQTIAERSKVDPAKIKKDIEATFETERQGFRTQLGGMEATLFKHLVQNTARGALSEHKGNELFLMPHIERQAKVVKDDSGEYVVRVVDGEGQYRGDGKGGFMGVNDLVAELKANKAYAGAFESSNGGGGGGPQGQPPRTVVRNVIAGQNQDNKTGISKIASGLEALRRA